MPLLVADRIAHYANLQSCGSIWACPVCSAKVREGRRGEARKAARAHVEAGGLLVLQTLTVQHGVHQRLAELLPLVADAFRAMISGRDWLHARQHYGVVGTIRSMEITHGANGWHPHLHVMVFLEHADHDLADELVGWLSARWSDFIAARGYVRPTQVMGEVVTNYAAAADYIVKTQDAERVDKLAAELTRHDLKRGRRSNRTPFQVLEDFTATGDIADLTTWWEYERATKGRQAITWSKGLRALYDVDTLTDEELAAAEIGGVQVCEISAEAFAVVVRRRLGLAELLVAAEAGGIVGVRRALARMGIDPAEAYAPPATDDS